MCDSACQSLKSGTGLVCQLEIDEEFLQADSYVKKYKLKIKKKKKKKKKALTGFEPVISCLLDRRFNQLSHRATC